MSLTVAPETIELFAQPGVGEVEETITSHHRGRVSFIATTWFAQFYYPSHAVEAAPGTTVRVIGREGLTLLVVPMDDWIHPPVPIAEQPEANQSRVFRLVQEMGSRFTTWLSSVEEGHDE